MYKIVSAPFRRSGRLIKTAASSGRTAAVTNGQRQTELDKKLVYSLAPKRIPSFKQLKYFTRYLSRREVWIIRASFLVVILSLAGWGTNFYFTHLESVPVPGGEYVEALVGYPKYINPLYAGASDADSDLTALIFSSLLRRDDQGELKNDLAAAVEMSEDGRIYTIRLRDDAVWHNGGAVTVDDVIFTFQAIQDIAYKSTLRASFVGTQIEKADETTLRFHLDEPYAAFRELLTFGILPRQLWREIEPETANLAELNSQPVGSGPYKFKSLIKDKNGRIKEYVLARHEGYYGGAPYIETLKFLFFPTFEEAIAGLNNQAAEGISYVPKELKAAIGSAYAVNFYELYVPQLSAVFFNQESNSHLKSKGVRQALAYAIDRQRIINDIIQGEALVTSSPIPPSSFAFHPGGKRYAFNGDEAGRLLDEAGWKNFVITAEEIGRSQEALNARDEKVRLFAETIMLLGPGTWRRKGDDFLIVKLTTVDRGENAAIVASIARDWETAGVKTVVETVPTESIQSQIIKPRQYEALYYGLVIGADPDMYPLWHSSQASAGLNIAKYSNREVDELLEDARLILDQDKRREKYVAFQEIIIEEAPAIFLFSPTYTYAAAKKIKDLGANTIVKPSDRFASINRWYIKTGKKLIWP